jgi:ubiquinol-cytochrome c reductase cytochrome c1 subunit
MKTLILALLVTFSGSVLASGGNVKLDKANINPGNEESLQNGFKYFNNYCLSCHSLAYSRYNRVAKDLGIPEELVEENIIFTRDEKGETSKIGSLMKTAMPELYANQAFGTAPPDLTLSGRARSADWLYTYLRGFYLDDSRPFGVNNTVFPDVGMPHVLWELQGWQAKAEHHDDAGHAKAAESGMSIVEPGSMTTAEYDHAVRDLVNFMMYVAEPAKQKRKSLGLPVLLFVLLFTVLAYFMKKNYWKDVH